MFIVLRTIRANGHPASSLEKILSTFRKHLTQEHLVPMVTVTRRNGTAHSGPDSNLLNAITKKARAHILAKIDIHNLNLLATSVGFAIRCTGKFLVRDRIAIPPQSFIYVEERKFYDRLLRGDYGNHNSLAYITCRGRNSTSKWIGDHPLAPRLIQPVQAITDPYRPDKTGLTDAPPPAATMRTPHRQRPTPEPRLKVVKHVQAKHRHHDEKKSPTSVSEHVQRILGPPFARPQRDKEEKLATPEPSQDPRPGPRRYPAKNKESRTRAPSHPFHIELREKPRPKTHTPRPYFCPAGPAGDVLRMLPRGAVHSVTNGVLTIHCTINGLHIPLRRMMDTGQFDMIVVKGYFSSLIPLSMVQSMIDGRHVDPQLISSMCHFTSTLVH